MRSDGYNLAAMSAGATIPAPSVDLFLSYNRLDRKAVSAVWQLLEARGVKSFLDQEYVTAGRPWPELVEAHLSSARAVAVFIGPHGLGAWQKREMYFALDRQASAERDNRSFPVIPVLLD